jgi:hypothetical protein
VLQAERAGTDWSVDISWYRFWASSNPDSKK